MDCVLHDSALDGTSAGMLIVDGALSEGLVAGDENHLVAVGLGRPIESGDCFVDDLSTVFVAAAGEEALK